MISLVINIKLLSKQLCKLKPHHLYKRSKGSDESCLVKLRFSHPHPTKKIMSQYFCPKSSHFTITFIFVNQQEIFRLFKRIATLSKSNETIRHNFIKYLFVSGFYIVGKDNMGRINYL